MLIVKFWLAITPDEQLRCFQERSQTPHKHYKITDEDWRNSARNGRSTSRFIGE